MKLKDIVIKFLIILIAFESSIDILKRIIPLPSLSDLSTNQTVIKLVFFYTISLGVFIILLLNDLYKRNTKFTIVLFAVLAFPILEQIITVCLGNVFFQFCPDQTSYNGGQGVMGLLNTIDNSYKNCPYQTRFDFSPFEQPVFCIKGFFSTYEFAYFWGFFLSPHVICLFLLFRYSLFMVFKVNNRNPYLSLIPIVNTITILKICKLPIHWIFILLIPFLQLFWRYKINKRLCEVQSISKSNAIWMTLLPSIFYGKLVFK